MSQRLRRAVLAACILAVTACGDRPAPRPQRIVLEGMPPEQAPAPAPPAPLAKPPTPPATPVAAVDETFARERDGWSASFTLRLPVLTEPAAGRIRRAAETLLFQGYETLPGGIAASGEAALAKRLIEDPVPADAQPKPWKVERTVTGTAFGRWLTLTRVMHEFAGGDRRTDREDVLIVNLATGRALEFPELVPETRVEALRAALAAALRTTYAIPAGKQIANLTSDAELPIPLPAPTANGLRFVWNPIEISVNEGGSLSVELPASVAAHLVAIDLWGEDGSKAVERSP